MFCQNAGWFCLGLIVSLAPGTLVAPRAQGGGRDSESGIQPKAGDTLALGLNGNTVAYIGLGLPAEKAGVKKIGDRIIPDRRGKRLPAQKSI